MAKVGDIIGNYRLLEEIASGSFGSVYRGVHTILTTRIVAIKILHLHLQQQQESEAGDALICCVTECVGNIPWWRTHTIGLTSLI